jgi:hypothetical protein
MDALVDSLIEEEKAAGSSSIHASVKKFTKASRSLENVISRAESRAENMTEKAITRAENEAGTHKGDLFSRTAAPESFRECVDPESGNIYYVNTKTKESVWLLPRGAKLEKKKQKKKRKKKKKEEGEEEEGQHRQNKTMQEPNKSPSGAESKTRMVAATSEAGGATGGAGTHANTGAVSGSGAAGATAASGRLPADDLALAPLDEIPLDSLEPLDKMPLESLDELQLGSLDEMPMDIAPTSVENWPDDIDGDAPEGFI